MKNAGGLRRRGGTLFPGCPPRVPRLHHRHPSPQSPPPARHPPPPCQPPTLPPRPPSLPPGATPPPACRAPNLPRILPAWRKRGRAQSRPSPTFPPPPPAAGPRRCWTRGSSTAATAWNSSGAFPTPAWTWSTSTRRSTPTATTRSSGARPKIRGPTGRHRRPERSLGFAEGIEMSVPNTIRIAREEGYHTDQIGTYADGRQFMGFVVASLPLDKLRAPEGWERHKQWHAVLHTFDPSGTHRKS